MRPSPRLDLMTPPLLGSTILGDLSGEAQALDAGFFPCAAGLADPAGLSALQWPPAGPGQAEELVWKRCNKSGLGLVINRVNPLDLGLAQLARAIARVHLVEYPPLAQAAVLDVGVGGERSHRDARAMRRIDRHLAGDERDRQVVDRNRLQRAEIE